MPDLANDVEIRSVEPGYDTGIDATFKESDKPNSKAKWSEHKLN